MTCDICGGCRSINLPIRYEVTLRVPSDAMTMDARPSSRSYPCPECTPAIRDADITVLENTYVDVYGQRDEKYQEALMRDMTGNLIGHIAREARITIKRASFRDEYKLRIGILSKEGLKRYD